MTTKIFTDRSRIVTADRCKRRRFLEYHQDGTGIVPTKMPLPLAVGIAVHAGLAVLLQEKQEQITADATQAGYWSDVTIEDHAVAAALREFAQFSQSLEVDTTESAAMQPTPAADVFQSQVVAQARELGMDEAAIAGLARDPAVARSEFDRYLQQEQAALVEGMVRAYARRRLRPLLEQFEVLEVEREGEWKLSEWEECVNCHKEFVAGEGLNDCHNCGYCDKDNGRISRELWFMSRPDALLRERQSNELYLLSYKTTATWDARKARDIEHDMQGLSEGVEVERRLGEWWRRLSEPTSYAVALSFDIPTPVYKYLKSLAAPPRIHAIRYEFLLKGYRAEDKELSARLGITAYTQHSHLVRQYVATSVPKKGDGGYRVGDTCWSWEYFRVEDDKDSKLSWQNWHSRPVFDRDPYVPMHGESVKEWIDALDASELLMSGEDSTVGLQPRALGWKSPAQAMGVTKEHPLDEVFVPPVTVWRSEDDLRDWVESIEHQEREVAQHVAEIDAMKRETSLDNPLDGQIRSSLNKYFPMNRSSCSYPSECPYVKVCYAGAEMKADPLAVGAGMFKKRIANHPVEEESWKNGAK